MKYSWVFLLLLCLVGIIGLGAATMRVIDPPETKRFTIVDPSRLYLTGTTNVNTFTCDCRDRFPTQTIEVEHNDRVAMFKSARLRMRTQKFDCHNAKMDRDMHKALKAEEFPYIKIELVRTRQDPDQIHNGDWFDVLATVKLTITDVSKEKQIQARARKVGENRFVLQGEQSLKMTEFGIDPPEALFGLIKVDDLITFHFDLTIQVEDIAE